MNVASIIESLVVSGGVRQLFKDRPQLCQESGELIISQSPPVVSHNSLYFIGGILRFGPRQDPVFHGRLALILGVMVA